MQKLKLLLAVVLVLIALSVAGCCGCCSSSGYSGYYSTVGQDETSAGCTCDTPYDCQSGTCADGCTCQK